jgi:hypothetical protein
MRALRLHEDGLRLEQIPVPEPGPGEALVRVHAAAITRDELTWSTDRLPAIPSYELSGTLVDSGDEVVALTPFDRDGVAADHAVVPTALLTAKPPGLSHVEAAALVMGALTSQQGLFVHGRLQPGERFLLPAPREESAGSPFSSLAAPGRRWSSRSLWSWSLILLAPIRSPAAKGSSRSRLRHWAPPTLSSSPMVRSSPRHSKLG